MMAQRGPALTLLMKGQFLLPKEQGQPQSHVPSPKSIDGRVVGGPSQADLARYSSAQALANVVWGAGRRPEAGFGSAN